MYLFKLTFKDYIEKINSEVVDSNLIVDDVDDISYTRENFINLIKYNKLIVDEINKIITYTEYLRQENDNNIKYAEYLAANLTNVLSYLNLKYNDDYSIYTKMVDDGKSEIEIKAFLRKAKIKNILNTL